MKSKLLRFRLKVGKHQDGHPSHVNKETNELEREDTRRFFNANDSDNNIIDTEIDLVKMFGSEKFELIAE